jgi:flagellar biosynthetic protein FliR
MDHFIIPLDLAVKFLIIMVRVGGIVTFAPFWSFKAIAPRIRVAFVFLAALLLFPALAPELRVQISGMAPLLITVGSELMIGLAIGLVGRMLLAACELAAHLIGFQAGISLVNIIDPGSQVNAPALLAFFSFIGVIWMLGVNGHHWFLQALVDSFRLLPPGQARPSGQFIELLIKLSANILVIGIKLSAPVLVALLILDLILALTGKAAPQIQILIDGISIKILTGIWVLGLSIYYMSRTLNHYLGNLHRDLYRVIETLAKG